MEEVEGGHFTKGWPSSYSSTCVSAYEGVFVGAWAVSWIPDGDPSGRLGQFCIVDCLVRKWLVIVHTSQCGLGAWIR